MILCTLNIHLGGEENEENILSYVGQETQSLIQQLSLLSVKPKS